MLTLVTFILLGFNYKMYRLVLQFMMISTVLLAVDVYAHKVNVFTYVENDQIFVEGYYQNGSKAKNSQVVAYDSEGTRILAGTTDNMGQFTFSLPEKKILKITLDAGMGHKAQYLMTDGDFAGGDMAAEKPSKHDKTTPLANMDPVSSTGSTAPQEVLTTLSTKQLEAIVKNAVTAANKPLVRSLKEMQGQQSLTDVISGIGYICGILGLVLYMQTRKKG